MLLKVVVAVLAVVAVKARAVVASLSTVELNKMLPPDPVVDVVNTTSAPNVTAPLYVWVPEVVIEPVSVIPLAFVLVRDMLDKPLIPATLKAPLPTVNVNPCALPVTAPPNVTFLFPVPIDKLAIVWLS